MDKVIYKVGDLVNGDYDDDFDTFEQAQELYDAYVQERFEFEQNKEEEEHSLSMEECKEFFYIKQVIDEDNDEWEIIVGGTFEMLY